MYELEEAEIYADYKDGVITKAEFERRLKELKEFYSKKEKKSNVSDI